MKEILHHPNIRNFFDRIPTLVIVIPLLIITGAIIYKAKLPATSFPSLTSLPVPTIGTALIPQPTTASSGSSASSSGQLNLTGPYVCSYSDGTMKATASINKKQIYAEIVRKNEVDVILITGDCFYNWDKGEATGEKICGMSQFMDLFDSLAKLNLVDMQSIMNSVNQLQPSRGVSLPPVATLTSSCQKKEVDNSLFVIPKQIQFKEGTLPKGIKQP